MNAITPIVAERPTIASVRHWHALDRYSVVLGDGRLGIGETEAEALANASLPDAENVRRAA